jgi:hypothetical protein
MGDDLYKVFVRGVNGTWKLVLACEDLKNALDFFDTLDGNDAYTVRLETPNKD